MLIHRRYNVPAMPMTLRELSGTIHNFEPVRGFYRGACTGTGGSTALIFIHENFLEPLSQCTLLHMDGTLNVSILS